MERNLNLDIPDPRVERPLGDKRTVFIKPGLAATSRILVGDYSYYDASEDDGGFEETRVLYAFGAEQLVIGRFCSIAAGVTFIMAGANHIYSGPSSFPFANFPGDWQESLLDPLIASAPPRKGNTLIGNDVWIGRDATVMPGVTIGDGAIVGARAVIASDVAPYHIVAGNPGRLIRTRYPDNEISMLLAAQWWNWPIEVVTRHLPELVLGTPSGILAIAETEGLSGRINA